MSPANDLGLTSEDKYNTITSLQTQQKKTRYNKLWYNIIAIHKSHNSISEAKTRDYSNFSCFFT